jgi:outer membrane cobalamin receptor
LKLLGRRFFVGLCAFRYRINDMIERFRLDPSTYTYGNIEKGRIQGLELEFEALVLPSRKIFGSVFTIRGRSLQTDTPLNDIPPFHISAGIRVWRGRFSAGLRSRGGARQEPQTGRVLRFLMEKAEKPPQFPADYLGFQKFTNS